MGIMNRMRDLVASNVNAMLDKAEDPEKLIRQLIHELEDVLIRIKADCASAMAQAKSCGRLADEARRRAEGWQAKAKTAVDKGRDDLAREALMEKRRQNERAQSLEAQGRDFDGMVEEHRQDVVEIEGRLRALLERQSVLVQRHMRARTRRRAQESIRRTENGDILERLEALERRTARSEAEADLVNYGCGTGLAAEFDRMAEDDEIEAELERLKAEATGS